jgi:hypothetical protein
MMDLAVEVHGSLANLTNIQSLTSKLSTLVTEEKEFV